MAILATQTIVGNVGSVYELRTVGKDNRSVVDFSVAVTPRRKDGDEWVDGTTYWITVTAWGKLADNISAGWKKGDRVIVVGRTEMKDGYTNKNGEEVPARPTLVAEFAGHEDSMNPSTQERASRSGGNGERRPASTPAAQQVRKPAQKPAPAPAADELDFNLDDEEFDF